MKIEMQAVGIVLTDHWSRMTETDSPWTYNEYKPLKKMSIYMLLNKPLPLHGTE